MKNTSSTNKFSPRDSFPFTAPIRAAIFDYDGTILDSMPMWATTPSRFVRSLGAEPQPGLDEKIKHLSLEEGAQIFRTYGASGNDDEIIEQIMEIVLDSYRYELQPKPGILNVLEDLRQQGIPMCIATQTPSPMIKVANERLGLSDYFTGVFSCGEWDTNKREPRIYELAAAHLQTPPSETLVFEDAYYAVKTAANAGFPVIGIYDDSFAGDREQIENSSCLYLENYAIWPGLKNLMQER